MESGEDPADNGIQRMNGRARCRHHPRSAAREPQIAEVCAPWCGVPPGSIWKSRTSAEGFSLLEVLVSLAIMAIAITLLLQLFSASLRGISRSGDITSAALKGDSRIREILAGPDLQEKAWSEATEDGYRLDITVSEVLKERTDSLPVKLMEVTLTVHWSEGMGEKSLSLRTMKMVDKVPAAAANPPAPA